MTTKECNTSATIKLHVEYAATKITPAGVNSFSVLASDEEVLETLTNRMGQQHKNKTAADDALSGSAAARSQLQVSNLNSGMEQQHMARAAAEGGVPVSAAQSSLHQASDLNAPYGSRTKGNRAQIS